MSARREPTVERQATSIKIRPDLWRRAKIEAIQRDMDLSELVEEALEQYIDDEAENQARGERRRG